MASTDHLTDEEFVTILKAETQAHYWRLFNLGVGGRFHSFLEWCGVMGEHLNITSDLLKQGLPAFEMNRHTGETRSEEHTSELQSLMRISYAVFCLKNKNNTHHLTTSTLITNVLSCTNSLK